MIFLVDAQLPPALARALAEQGHDAVHVCDIKLNTAPDTVVWEVACQRGAVIVTKDEDFVVRSRRESDMEKVPAVVWVRVGNTSRKVLLGSFMPVLPAVLELLESGEKIVEVR